MKKLFVVFLVLFAGTMLLGCATAPNERLVDERLERTYIGMSLEDFRVVWPDATFQFTRLIETGEEVLGAFFPRRSFTSTIVMQFVFRDNILFDKYTGQ